MENLTLSNEYINNKRKSQILKNFNITGDSIKLEDVNQILDKVNTEDLEVTKEAVQKVFNELDKDGNGVIKSESFVNYILSINENNQMFSKFIPKSAKVLEKLRKLKSKAFLKGDKDSQDDIDWIISVISESNLYEPEYSNIIPRPSKTTGYETLAKYSQMEEAKMRESDIIAINSMKNSPRVTHIDFSQRRSTRLSSFISPSIFAKINMHLASDNTIDFNIFELDALVGTKTTFYISYDIFSKIGIFETEKVDEEIFKNFVRVIIEGCNRSLPYHNDLHAGDVLQTLFTIMEQGEMQRVILIIYKETWTKSN